MMGIDHPPFITFGAKAAPEVFMIATTTTAMATITARNMRVRLLISGIAVGVGGAVGASVGATVGVGSTGISTTGGVDSKPTR